MKSNTVKILIIGIVLVALSVFGIIRNEKGIINRLLNIQIRTPTPVNLNSDKLWKLVNDWREKQGFSPFINNPDLCTHADNFINNKSSWTDAYFRDYFTTNIPLVDFSSYYWLFNTFSDSEESVLENWVNNNSKYNLFDNNIKNSCIKCNGTYCIQLFSIAPILIPQEELITAVNNYRSAHGVKTLKINQELCKYAELIIQDMFKLHEGKNHSDQITMNHDRIDSDVRSGRIYNYIHGKREFGENIAVAKCRWSETESREVKTASDVTDYCFENSPKHKEVLLDPIWTDVCSIGILPFYIEIFAK